MLTRQGVRATFKVVGEKARTLERRGRRDVIAALTKHEIGYHSNYAQRRSRRRPCTSERSAGTTASPSSTAARGTGVEDVERIFGLTPVCYGQPGSSWGPQSLRGAAGSGA